MTTKAVKLAKGEIVNDISDKDWEDYLAWEERCELIAPIMVKVEATRFDANGFVLKYRFARAISNSMMQMCKIIEEVKRAGQALSALSKALNALSKPTPKYPPGTDNFHRG